MKITKTTTPKQKPDEKSLGFGKYFTDHMFIMDYSQEKGWHDARIVPYAPFVLDPATTVFHYGQSVFEGMKAYKDANGQISLFRPMDNFARMNRSCDRMCIPQFDAKEVYDALVELVKIDADWIPTAPGTALYIRPTIIATDPQLGVHAAHNYIFYIILSPVGAYYEHGLQPVKIFIEEFYVRAAIGGTGEAKCSGNYAASLKAGEKAKEKGFEQVLWLDAATKSYVEEVGAMNMFFVIGDEVVTPALVGSILPGITRNSIIQILKQKGMKVSERRISVQEIMEATQKGTLKEAFGTGTAAVVSPVGSLYYKDNEILVNGGEMGKTTLMLYETLTGIQTGKLPDPFGWVIHIK